MATIYADDPNRYQSTHALVVAPAEVGRELATYGRRISLTPDEKRRAAEKLHATWTEPES